MNLLFYIGAAIFKRNTYSSASAIEKSKAAFDSILRSKVRISSKLIMLS